MQIIFERSGGLMGSKSSVTVNLDDLPPDQARMFRLLLDDANFFALSEDSLTPINPDGFQYIITVETDTLRHTIQTTDTTMPETLRPLIEKLSHLARTYRHC